MDLRLKETRPYIKVFNSLRSASFCLGRSGKGAKGNHSFHCGTSWRSVQETAQKKNKTTHEDRRLAEDSVFLTCRASRREKEMGRERFSALGFFHRIPGLWC